MIFSLFLLLFVGLVWGAALRKGGRWRGSIVGAVLLGPITFLALGRALAGHLNPLRTRFQNFPVDSIGDSALFFNLSFWTAVWGVALYFLLPRFGKRWRP
ncbi:MAG TPA: hypothetical protein VJU61_00830 [Polyangiaceae bacterium]|nr:hypothetical protein [Polyangiaceae bacterium]